MDKTELTILFALIFSHTKPDAGFKVNNEEAVYAAEHLLYLLDKNNEHTDREK